MNAIRTPLIAGCFLALLFSFFNPPLQAKPPGTSDIADTVDSNRILTQFAAQMHSAGLDNFLSSRGPFTLFAPTDAAFSRLPPETLASLRRPENKERLQHILLYNIVNGQSLTAKDLLPLNALPSCEGIVIEVNQTPSGAQMVDHAKIIQSDIRCRNGVINEVDTVLMPPESSLPPLIVIPSVLPNKSVKALPVFSPAPQLGSVD